ncbi:6-phospho-3-hexuloisomerase [Staphylococcus sp. 17KM0847]|uniref:6-phospho-3-hexuloisomerase n=1 Tax=Staphylococcus sp. 17KM0847 TaxID=2583989 RepID=UPI0015E05190|nr:6-phospho-3-hexuloisomerase [Staphylococcus sp. 17KM0847]
MQQPKYQLILDELSQLLHQIDIQSVKQLTTYIMNANAVFVAGKGRSGLVAQSFAMRLNQLGRQAYVVGETTTPPIQKGDCLLFISGSGSTAHLQYLADKATSVGAMILLITTEQETPIGEYADSTVILPASTKHRVEGSIQPMGSLFEQSSQIILDSIVLNMQEQLNMDEQDMQRNHANLE